MDPAERRHDLAEAVWRVVRREGLDGASVRAVAREAGLSMGSLRHYFGTQSELLVFAMRMVIDRIERRVAGLQTPGDPRRAAEMVLLELLPLDDERRAENEVWLAFTARALVDPALRALRDELPAFGLGVAYAVSDELHQHFVEGRVGAPLDVLIDGVGVAIGVLLWARIVQRVAR